MLTEYQPNPFTNQAGDRTLPRNLVIPQSISAPRQHPTPDTKDIFHSTILTAACSAFVFYWMDKWRGNEDTSVKHKMCIAIGAALGTIVCEAMSEWSFTDW